MSAFGNAVINLDEPEAVYYSGQEIIGSVTFDLDLPLTFSAITIVFKGEANVLWTEEQVSYDDGERRCTTIKYIGGEGYFKHTEVLAGGLNDSTSTLPIGRHELPFKYRIPSTAPSSFDGEKGDISYLIRVTLIPSAPPTLEHQIEKAFKVIAPMDLNVANERVKMRLWLEFEEIYGCDFFCGPSPMRVRVNLPASGFCPGQIIPVAVEVDNESRIEIVEMVFKLTTKVRYRSQHPVGEFIPEEKVLCSAKRGAVMGASRRQFEVPLPAPNILAANLEGCSIIDVGYFFKVLIKLSGCNDDLEDESEICLGLVPLRNLVKGDYVHPMAHKLPKGPIPEPTTREIPIEHTFNSSQSNTSSYPGQNIPYPDKNTAYPNQATPNPNSEDPSNNSYSYSVQSFSTNHGIGFKVSEQSVSSISFTLPSFPTQGRTSPFSGYPGYPGYPADKTAPSAPPPY